ncbi:ethanolamine utilization protein EutH, partial [Tessaracoccus lubricantis]
SSSAAVYDYDPTLRYEEPFIPVAGVMAALPFLSKFVESVLGPVWKAMGSDPSMAATTFIATDMGGYHLAQETASSTGDWITAI